MGEKVRVTGFSLNVTVRGPLGRVVEVVEVGRRGVTSLVVAPDVEVVRDSIAVSVSVVKDQRSKPHAKSKHLVHVPDLRRG